MTAASHIDAVERQAAADLDRLMCSVVDAKSVGTSGTREQVSAGAGSSVPEAEQQPGTSGNSSSGPRARFVTYTGRKGCLDGVHYIGVTTDRETNQPAEQEPMWICSPLAVKAYTRDTHGAAWGRWLIWHDADGREHRWAMPMHMLAADGAELRGELLRQGLEIAQHQTARRQLGEYIQRERPALTARCVERTGWHDGAFVLPAETIGQAADSELTIFQTSAPDGIKLGSNGTLEGWYQSVAMPCAGNSRLVLATSIGFAAVCLGLVGAEGGGVHLKGGSSIGKTTGLAVAASMFGPPDYARTWRQTDNAMEGVAALHSDLLLILDEQGQLEPKHAGAMAYLLANGQGKGRASRNGAPRAASQFRLLFLSSGEIGLGDLVTASGGKQQAGMEVRVIDVPADAGAGLGIFDAVPDGVLPGVFAERFKAAAAVHYGHAVPAFLRALVRDVEGHRHLLSELRDAFTADHAPNASGQVRRVAQRFALIAAAGELATQFGITGWAAGEAERSVSRCFTDWLNARGSSGQSEPVAMLAQVRAFLSAHGESRFSDWEADPRDRVTINRAGFRRSTSKGPEYFIEVEAWKRDVCAGLDPKQVAELLRDHGALNPESTARMNRRQRLPDGRNARVYHVTAELWEVEV